MPKPDFSGNDPHWIETWINGAPCWAFSGNPQPGEHISWSGACSNQLLSGQGTLTWYDAGERVSEKITGMWVGGLLEGAATVAKPMNNYRAQDHYKVQSQTIQFRHGSPVTGQVVASQNDVPASPQSSSSADPAILADIAEVNKSITSPPGALPGYKNPLQNDPTANGMSAKWTVANFFFMRDNVSCGNEGPDEECDWSVDKSFDDFKKARRWYQIILDQEQSEIAQCAHGPCSTAQRRIIQFEYLGDVVHLKRLIGICDEQIKRSPENQRKEAANQARLAEEQAQAFEKKLPRLLAERKDIGDEVCDGQGGHGYVEKVHGNKIDVSTEHGYAWKGVLVNQWQQYQWIDYNTVYKCDEAE